MSASKLITAALEASPRPMSCSDLAEATGLDWRSVGRLVRINNQTIVQVGFRPAEGGAHGGGRPSRLYTLASRASAFAPLDPSRDEGPNGLTAADFEPNDDRETDDLRPSSWIMWGPSDKGFHCSRLGQHVTFARCISQYTDATALKRQVPCNGCPDGARRRADYAEGRGVTP